MAVQDSLDKDSLYKLSKEQTSICAETLSNTREDEKYLTVIKIGVGFLAGFLTHELLLKR